MKGELDQMNKRKTRVIWITVMLVIIIGGFSYTAYTIPSLNKYYPFSTVQTGYVVLPEEVTYNNGQHYNDKTGKRQFPDPYKNMKVVNANTKEIDILTFSGGQSPEGKNFAKVKYKLEHVYKIDFIAWNEIPNDVREELEVD